MLKTRIIPVLLHRGRQAIKGRQFDGWRSVGSIVNAVRVHARRGVDELCLLDIGATPEGRDPDFALIRDLSAVVMSPLTIGGGITSVEHFREALRCGADKVAVRSAVFRDIELIDRAAQRFGRQAVTVALDVVGGPETEYVAIGGDFVPVQNLSGSPDGGGVKTGPFLRRLDVVEARGPGPEFAGLGGIPGDRGGPFVLRQSAVEFAKLCEAHGAGELLVTSVSRDGCLCGYDIELIRDVASAVSIPVVANGGAGSYADLAAGIRAGAHAVAAGALWQFTDSTPAEAADYLSSEGFLVRRERSTEPDNIVVAAPPSAQELNAAEAQV